MVRRLSLLVVPAALFGATSAHAFETEVYAESAAQGYAVTSPWGAPSVARRRFLQTLGLGVYDLQGDYVPGGPQIFVKLRVRLDADFGIADDELVYDPSSRRFVPNLYRAPVDLMYGYVEGRNLARGWLGFRLGRQYVTDALGWWAFDGGLVRLTTPVFFAIDVYGGLEERGGLPLSTPRFEQNGIWRGDRTGFDPSFYPQFQKASIAPAWGVALESAGVNWVHGRLDYRKVWNTGESVVTMVPDPLTGTYAKVDETRVSSERLGYAFDASAAKLGGVKGGIVYDFYDAWVTSYYGSLDWYATPDVTVGVDYDYFKPTFDADSIFNFFAHEPMRTVTGRGAWTVSRRFDVAASGGVRRFYTEGDPASYDPITNRDTTQTALTDVLGNAAVRYRWPSGDAGLRGMWETGDRGHREGADLYGEQRFLGGRYLVEGRTSLYDFEDSLRDDPTNDRSGRGGSVTSFSYVVGGGFRPAKAANVLVEWQHDMNRIVGQRYRVLAVLDVLVTR